MIPEIVLVIGLIVVFCADFVLHGKASKPKVIESLVALFLGVTTGVLFGVFFESGEQTAFGGLYVAGPIVHVMKIILTVGTAIVGTMSITWLKTNRRYEGEYYMLLLSTLLGMYIMLSSGSFLLFFLGLEMASVPMACLVAFDKKKKDSAEAAAKYILIATFSSGVMLFGISFVYAAAGSLYFDNVAEVITATPLSIIGMVFFFSGLGFKISLVPFHFWTADTYQGAPTPVTGYLSVISKGAATLTLAIILTKVFGSMIDYWQPMLWVVIMLTITIGNLMAIRQTELKRFMAFSSISQAGYIMLAVIGADAATSQAALTFYVLVYVVANLAVFTVISAVEHRAGAGTQMSAYNGLYQTNPKLAFIMTIALFSLAGIPPFAGMFSKFFVFMAGVQGHDAHPFWPYFVVFVALVNTVVSLYYYLLIVKAMYIKKEEHPLPAFAHGSEVNTALTVCTLGIVLFGVCSCIYQWIANAAGM